jgi:hypothetical protein
MCLFIIAISFEVEAREIWRGSTDVPLVPCSKEFTYKDDFGLTWSSLRTASQYVYGSIDIKENIDDAAAAALAVCAKQGVDAAGLNGTVDEWFRRLARLLGSLQ